MPAVSSQTLITPLLKGLRGELPAHDIAQALAALLYLRWADFQEAEDEAIAAFDDTEYEPVLPGSLHWRSWHVFRPEELAGLFADRLPSTLEQLGNARHNPLATHLHRIAGAVRTLGRMPSEILKVTTRWLADEPFETPDNRRRLLDTFDAVLDRTLDKASGQFRTPPAVARIMAELAAPMVGERVYDPCFGSASLLTAAWDHARRQDKARFSRGGLPTLSISGVERDPSAYVIGLLRLALAGIGDPQLELGNSLERMAAESPQREGFDVVLANPPFGTRFDAPGVDHYPVRTGDAAGLFVQHALGQLRPGGRAVIVVPPGFLFRSGPVQRLRRLLLEQHSVEAIVSLPETAFLPYTEVRPVLLVLRRNGPTRRIRMVDGAPYFEKAKGRHPAPISLVRIEQLAGDAKRAEPSAHCWDLEVTSLAEIDWDLTPKRRDQSGLSGVLDALRSQTEVLPLQQCCQILSGCAIRSDDLLAKPVGESPIPYLRIRDIQRGEAGKGSAWLSSNAAVSVGNKVRLRAGDVLVSKSGTIGKVGLVRNGALGAVAAHGLFILRCDQDRLDPHFLLAYLDSRQCRNWLDDKASGATVRHLSKRVLEELPVALPPLPVKQRVAVQHRERGLDALDCLTQVLTETPDDPLGDLINGWLTAALGRLEAGRSAPDDVLDLEPLRQLAMRPAPVNRCVECGQPYCLDEDAAYSYMGPPHDYGKGIDRYCLACWLGVGPSQKSVEDFRRRTPLADWLLAFNAGISHLRGVADVPRGPSLVSLLQTAVGRLRMAATEIRGELPAETRARALSDAVVTWLDEGCRALLADVKLVINTEAGPLAAGETARLSLQIHNQGAMPLREVSVKTEPDWGGGEWRYLAENATATTDLAGTTPDTAGPFALHVRWSGVDLDGQPIRGDQEIALQVSEFARREAGDFADLGGSPYVCGDPVRRERNDVFFGRDELLDRIRRQILQSGNVVLLEGNRRSGKSSILWHLEGPNSVPGWLGVYCSLQGAEGSRDGAGVPTAEVFRVMATSIAKSLQSLGGETPLPDGSSLAPGKKFGIARACREGIREESSFSDFRDYVELVLDGLAERHLGLLLMLDEFDKLQEGIDRGVTSPQVPENIRYLVQSYPRFSAILTGSRRLKRLREEHWSALYGLGTRFGVSWLSQDDARRLVREPVRGRLTFSPAAIERAISQTAGQPYLLQCVCNRIFDMAAQSRTRSVTSDLVDQAITAFVEDNEHFASLWDYAGSDRRRFLLALCHRADESSEPFRLELIQERLAASGIEVDDERVVADLEFLRELELIELVGDPGGLHYTLAIPLMGTWIERQQDFDALRMKAISETEDQHG